MKQAQFNVNIRGIISADDTDSGQLTIEEADKIVRASIALDLLAGGVEVTELNISVGILNDAPPKRL